MPVKLPCLITGGKDEYRGGRGGKKSLLGRGGMRRGSERKRESAFSGACFAGFFRSSVYLDTAVVGGFHFAWDFEVVYNHCCVLMIWGDNDMRDAIFNSNISICLDRG